MTSVLGARQKQITNSRNLALEHKPRLPTTVSHSTCANCARQPVRAHRRSAAAEAHHALSSRRSRGKTQRLQSGPALAGRAYSYRKQRGCGECLRRELRAQGHHQMNLAVQQCAAGQTHSASAAPPAWSPPVPCAGCTAPRGGTTARSQSAPRAAREACPQSAPHTHAASRPPQRSTARRART